MGEEWLFKSCNGEKWNEHFHNSCPLVTTPTLLCCLWGMGKYAGSNKRDGAGGCDILEWESPFQSKEKGGTFFDKVENVQELVIRGDNSTFGKGVKWEEITNREWTYKGGHTNEYDGPNSIQISN